VPFVVIRTISDGADEGAAVDFPRFVRQIASVYSHGILKNLLADGPRFHRRPGSASLGPERLN
jgi:adenosylhomocysteine nucleosidase